MFPICIDDVYADIATVWHWRPCDMDDMSLPEIMGWHMRALDRCNTEDDE